jgi:hypothetical protein
MIRERKHIDRNKKVNAHCDHSYDLSECSLGFLNAAAKKGQSLQPEDLPIKEAKITEVKDSESS